MLKTFIISPPFGNYISRSWATSVHGTFTLAPRPGLLKQTVKTFRPIKGGWINQIGFRNKGIKNVDFSMDIARSRLISVAGLSGNDDWLQILEEIPAECMVEINVGCPNVSNYSIPNHILLAYLSKFAFVSLKIPPTEAALYRAIDAHHHVGIQYVHMSNTLPTKRGGESGRRLRSVNLPLIKRMRTMAPEINIIGGGGIYSAWDLKSYKNAGANHFSLSTVWFTPWKIRQIKKIID